MKKWFCRLAWPIVIAGCLILVLTAVWPLLHRNWVLLSGWLLVLLGVIAYVCNQKRRNGY